MVGDVAHRVDGLLGGPGGDQHLQALHILFQGQVPQDVLEHHLRLHHLAHTAVTAGQMAAHRLDQLHAVVLQLFQIVLHDGVFVHLGVHGRSHQLFALAGQQSGGEHIVRQTIGQLTDHVGGGGGHQGDVRLLGHRHMLHIELKVPVKGIHQAFVAGEGLEGDGVDKVGGVLGHQHLNVRVLLDQKAGHGGHFICRDAAGDRQHHMFSLEHVAVSPFCPATGPVFSAFYYNTKTHPAQGRRSTRK